MPLSLGLHADPGLLCLVAESAGFDLGLGLALLRLHNLLPSLTVAP